MLDLLMEAQQQLRHLPNQRIGLENLLLKLMRSYRKMPVEHLVRRLIELEEGIAHLPELRSTPTPSASQQELALSVEKTENEMKAPPATQTAVSVPAQPAQPPVQSQATAVKNEGQKDSPPPAAPRVLSDAERQTQRQKQAKLDTLLQFAKVELGGSIEKKGPLKFDD
jgi:DNA polymerase III gamma/tau subunit